jgi:hypothetical protein
MCKNFTMCKKCTKISKLEEIEFNKKILEKLFIEINILNFYKITGIKFAYLYMEFEIWQ